VPPSLRGTVVQPSPLTGTGRSRLTHYLRREGIRDHHKQGHVKSLVKADDAVLVDNEILARDHALEVHRPASDRKAALRLFHGNFLQALEAEDGQEALGDLRVPYLPPFTLNEPLPLRFRFIDAAVEPAPLISGPDR